MRALRAPPFFKIFYAFVCKKVPGKITEFFFCFQNSRSREISHANTVISHTFDYSSRGRRKP